MSILKNLFGKTQHQEQKNSSSQSSGYKIIYEQQFVQSHSFKGYKRFNVSYYGYEPAEKGLAKFRQSGSDLDGAEIILQFVKRGQFNFVDVQINNFLVGSVTMWSDDDVLTFFRKQFCTGKVTKAHIKIEYETILSEDKKGKLIQNEREKIYLFLKSEN